MTARSCPDGGACHHDCGTASCWRVTTCEPLSGIFPDDTWPPAVRAAHAAPNTTIESIIVGRPDADNADEERAFLSSVTGVPADAIGDVPDVPAPRPITVAFVCPIETCRATREISVDDFVRHRDPICKGAEAKEHPPTPMVHRPAQRMTTPDLRHRP